MPSTPSWSETRRPDAVGVALGASALLLALAAGGPAAADSPRPAVKTPFSVVVEPGARRAAAAAEIGAGAAPAGTPGSAAAEAFAPDSAAVAPSGTPPAAASVLGEWRPAAIHGADVRSIAIHPDDPDLLLAGTSAGHLYRSSDGGATWAEAGPRAALAGWVVSDLVFDPDRPGRLWAALWGVWGGGMVLVSDDLGEVWSPRAEGLPGHQVYTLAAAGGGRLYAGTRTGVYGSTDGGESWRELTAALPEIEKVTSLLLDPARPNEVTAGTWQRAYRSDDGGATWRGVFEGMILDSEVFALARAPGRGDEVWASTCGWVYRSLDGGESWRRFQQAGADDRRTPSVTVLPSGRVIAGTVGGLYVTDDGGATWRHGGPDLAVLDLVWHPAKPERVVVATEGSGVWISDDGGSTVRRAAGGMTNVRVGALAEAGGEVLAAVNHAGPASGVYALRDGGAAIAPPARALPPVLSLAVAGPRVFAATERGLWERSGADWRLVAELGERRVEQVVAAGSRVVARTADGLWESPGAGARFHPLADHGTPRDDATAAHPTGDRRWPAVVVTPEGAFLAGPGANPGAGAPAEAEAALHPLGLPAPAAAVSAALIAGDRLYVGTSGWGLWTAALSTASDGTGAPTPPAVTAVD
jgi:photosystem II stability/assembly factor-like uncharacterized protein